MKYPQIVTGEDETEVVTAAAGMHEVETAQNWLRPSWFFSQHSSATEIQRNYSYKPVWGSIGAGVFE